MPVFSCYSYHQGFAKQAGIPGGMIDTLIIPRHVAFLPCAGFGMLRVHAGGNVVDLPACARIADLLLLRPDQGVEQSAVFVRRLQTRPRASRRAARVKLAFPRWPPFPSQSLELPTGAEVIAILETLAKGVNGGDKMCQMAARYCTSRVERKGL